MMRILKIRWWIPASLTLLALAAFLAIDYYNARIREDFSSSTGLGAVADRGIIFHSRQMWRQRAPSLSFAPPPMAASIELENDEVSARESAFVETTAERLSTFSIDVDTASYTRVRLYLNEGSLPTPDMVRIEEMLNYFSYSYPDPTGNQPFSLTTEIAGCPWANDHRLLRVGLKSKPLAISELPPSHLTFLIDVSGSMAQPNRLPLVKRSFSLLIQQLRPQDTVAIVVYAGAAGLVLPPTPGSQQRVIQEALDNLRAGGSTAGGEGIKLAYATARSMYRGDANNRVVLATDGDFNVGVSSDAELVSLIESQRDHGIFLTLLGFGMENFKDKKLEKLADHGNGHYAYVDSILEARRVFIEQLGGTLQTVAKDVKIQLDFNPARVKSYRLIGYEDRRLTKEDFRDDRKDAGELGAGHSVTALYELVPNGNAPLPEDSFTVLLRYKLPESNQSIEISSPGSAEHSSPSQDFRFAAAIAQFGLLLVQSEHKGASSYQAALDLASSSTGNDASRAELLQLIRKASQLQQSVKSPTSP